MLRTGGIRRDKRKINGRAGHAGKLDFCFLRSFLDTLHRHLVAGKVNTALHPEALYDPIDDALVKIIATQTVVARRSQNFLYAVTHLNDGHVKSTAAQVIHHDLLIVVLIYTIGKGRSGRLVDDTLHIQTGNFTGILGCLTLCIRKVSRYGDHRAGNSLAQICFRVRLQLLQYHRGNLLRSITFIVNGHLVIGAHFSLNRSNRTVGVGDGLTLCHLPHHAFAGFGKSHHRRRGAGALGIGDDDGFTALNDCNTGIGCAQIDTNSL